MNIDKSSEAVAAYLCEEDGEREEHKLNASAYYVKNVNT